jgi:hypothetical protein
MRPYHIYLPDGRLFGFIMHHPHLEAVVHVKVDGEWVEARLEPIDPNLRKEH